MKKFLYYLSSLAILAFIVLFLFDHYNEFSNLISFSWQYLPPLLILALFDIYLTGLILKELTLPFKIDLKDLTKISAASSLLNLILPFRAGAAFRAVYMKKVYSLKYSFFISSLFGNYVIVFFTSSLIALLLIFYYFLASSTVNLILLAIFTVIFLFTISVILFHFRLKGDNFLVKKVNKFLEGWEIIAKDKKVMYKLLLLNTIKIFVFSLRVYTAFLVVGLSSNFVKALFFSVVNLLSTFINLTPGGLGIVEMLYVFVGMDFEMSSSISLIVALVVRAGAFFILFTFGLYSYIVLLNKLKKNK